MLTQELESLRPNFAARAGAGTTTEVLSAASAAGGDEESGLKGELERLKAQMAAIESRLVRK